MAYKWDTPQYSVTKCVQIYNKAPTPTTHTSDIYLVVEFKMPSKAEGVLLITPTQSF